MGAKLTRQGYDKLRNELHYLQTTKRREIIEAIATARAHGDLKENAEYDAAKNEQGHLEKRIAELNDILSTATVLDDTNLDTSKAYLGAILTLQDLERDREFKYMLVSKEEANLKDGKISIESPVGRNLLGKAVGEEIEISIPAGTLRYKLLQIER
jgi:transcription elongation factor GreA